ncbi:zinc ribbon domain-containing protein [Sulfurisphaera tokodaii]|uniref:Transposase n=2 Tax=Sulfurisphaera tokodaii TaxID=111955 RepID=Q96Y41_SULTO|nr:zinc ribbon domain-containing protein [Sulfurisphaera tokodaii]BAB67436.1 putative transposase [Sulfurisphaera tokodaii str. 7]HII75147.1 transposase [Sulfurisphaera tokodaii]
MNEELVEAKIIDYGTLRELYKEVQFIRQYSKILKMKGQDVGPPPHNIPKELYYLALNSNEVKYGPIEIVGNNPYKLKGINAIVKSEREEIPLYAVIDFTNNIKVYLAYEKPRSIVGVDIGVRHLITIVALRNGKLWKTRFWGKELITDEMIKILGNPQGVSEIKNIRNKVKKVIIDIVNFIDELNPKIVALEDLRIFENKVGNTLRNIEIELEQQLYSRGIKYKLVDPYNTSKICSNCGFKKGEVLGPLFVCPACGFKADRDFNAAYNLALKCYYTC